MRQNKYSYRPLLTSLPKDAGSGGRSQGAAVGI